MIWQILFFGLCILAVYFFCLSASVWHAFKNLYYAGKNIADFAKNYRHPTEKKYSPPKNIYTDPSRCEEARKIRREIRAVRHANRQKRLNFALSRWSGQTNTSFADINRQASQKARAYLENRRKLK